MVVCVSVVYSWVLQVRGFCWILVALLGVMRGVMKYLDLFGSLCDFSGTTLFARLSSWAWPLSMLGVLLNALLFLSSGLYGSFLLQAVYCVSTLAGWYYWFSVKNQKGRPLKRLSISALSGYVLLACPSVMLMHTGLVHFSASAPWRDAVTTTLSLLAEWLLCLKVLENWLFWFVADAVYVFLFAQQGLVVHSLESAAYLIVVSLGYLRWRKAFLKQGSSSLAG